ncbi:hypothetical protein Avbf_02289 [Armadillidium vulgare]|nr:hypothetical protein Avbf_02289 [Armadillidium vulgare]
MDHLAYLFQNKKKGEVEKIFSPIAYILLLLQIVESTQFLRQESSMETNHRKGNGLGWQPFTPTVS